MTRLDCNVCSCVYNEDDCCRRDQITVEGHDACVCPETCCGSFASPEDLCAEEGCDYETACNCVSEACGCVRKETKVSCDAVECRYNSEHICCAAHIGISGRHADSAAQTECASFRLS